MARRRDTGASPENHLARHKLAVVFTECARWRDITWISGVGARCPVPAISEELVDAGPLSTNQGAAFLFPGNFLLPGFRSGKLPLLLGGQTAATPFCEGVRLEIAHVAHGRIKQR